MALKEDWNIDKNIKNNYIEKCKLFVSDEEAFKNFKRDKDYGKILEGNEEDVADIAYSYLIQHGGQNFILNKLKDFLKNDSIGNPQLWRNHISPATLRYVVSAYQISKLLGDFKPERILEIGGGYGGLCYILSVIYNFKEYTDKDLPEAEVLFNKYISNFGLLDKVNNNIAGEYDLFIADSSLSECNHKAQIEYFEQALKAKHIFLVYNTFHKKGNEDLFIEMKQKILTKFYIDKVPSIMTKMGMQDFTNTYLCKRR